MTNEPDAKIEDAAEPKGTWSKDFNPEPVSYQLSSVDEIVNWLVSIRAPGVFDTRAPFAIVPEGIKVIDLERNMPFPRMVRKRISFTDVASFVDYFNLFKDSYKPRLFTTGSNAGMSIFCVLDYDGPGRPYHNEAGEPIDKVSEPLPMWNRHTALLNLCYHSDYATLRASDNKFFGQEEFALFVEENTHLFTTPDGATMLELAQELKGARNASFQSGKRLANGQIKIEYIEQLEAKGVRRDFEIPEYLIMNMPIFEGFAAQEIKAAFRWRMDDGGKVYFAYRLLTKVAERKAVDEVKINVSAQTRLPLYAVSTFEGITENFTNE